MKIRAFLNKDLIRVSFFSSISTIVRILTRLITNKVIAVLIGPSGIALLGQLSSLLAIVNPLSFGGIKAGVTKYVAQYKDNKEYLKSYLSNSVRIAVFCSVLTAIVLIIFSKKLAVKVLFNEDYRIIIIVLALFLILFSLNNIALSIINGFKRFRLFIKLNIISSVIGLIFTIILTYYFKIIGALLALVTYQSFVFIFTIYYLKRSSWFKKEYFYEKLDIGIIKKYMSFSSMTLISAFTLPTAQLVIRNSIITDLSIDSAGYWEAVNRISALYLLFFTTSISTYYLPRISEIKSRIELKNEVVSTFKIVVPLLILASLSIFLLKDFIINVLFSKDFISMRELFKFQVIGDVFKISCWLLTYVMIAKAMTKLFILLEIVFGVSYVLFSLIGLKYFGIEGTTAAYALNYFLLFIVLIIIFKLGIFKKS